MVDHRANILQTGPSHSFLAELASNSFEKPHSFVEKLSDAVSIDAKIIETDANREKPYKSSKDHSKYVSAPAATDREEPHRPLRDRFASAPAEMTTTASAERWSVRRLNKALHLDTKLEQSSFLGTKKLTSFLPPIGHKSDTDNSFDVADAGKGVLKSKWCMNDATISGPAPPTEPSDVSCLRRSKFFLKVRPEGDSFGDRGSEYNDDTCGDFSLLCEH